MPDSAGVARWDDVVALEPDFAAAVRGFFDAHPYKTIATLRRDGSPRISGIEIVFGAGELWFGGLWESRKALDLRRDPRFALHSGPVAPPAWRGDAKLSGRAREITDQDEVATLLRSLGGGEHPSGPAHLFRAEITEASLVRVGDPADHLVVEHWREGRALRRRERR
jgi:hypothetical protein